MRIARPWYAFAEVNARIRASSVGSTPYYRESGDFTADLNFPPLNTACR